MSPFVVAPIAAVSLAAARFVWAFATAPLLDPYDPDGYSDREREDLAQRIINRR